MGRNRGDFECDPGARQGRPAASLRAAAAVAVAAAAIVVLGGGADAWREPEGFKGVRWGSAPEQLAVGFRLPLNEWARGKADPEGSERYAIGWPSRFVPGTDTHTAWFEAIHFGEVLLDLLAFVYFERRLEAVLIAFDPTEYSKIRDAFVARYGEPTRSQTRRYRNPLGATWESEELQWTGQATAVHLSGGFAIAKQKGHAVLGTREYFRRSSRPGKEQTEERLRALD